jgi:hypothetical protein
MDDAEQRLREHLAVESARFFSELEKENGVFLRNFESNHTIVEQSVINDCFYRYSIFTHSQIPLS